MMTFGLLALWIYVWMTSAKGIKPNDKTVPVHSLSLLNFDLNKNFSMTSHWMDEFSTIGTEVLKTHPNGGADGKNN